MKTDENHITILSWKTIGDKRVMTLPIRNDVLSM